MFFLTATLNFKRVFLESNYIFRSEPFLLDRSRIIWFYDDTKPLSLAVIPRWVSYLGKFVFSIKYNSFNFNTHQINTRNKHKTDCLRIYKSYRALLSPTKLTPRLPIRFGIDQYKRLVTQLCCSVFHDIWCHSLRKLC